MDLKIHYNKNMEIKLYFQPPLKLLSQSIHGRETRPELKWDKRITSRYERGPLQKEPFFIYFFSQIFYSITRQKLFPT